MANNNVQNVRFLRNGTLFTSREQATSTLTNFTLTSEMDGSSILARYQEGTDPIKTLVGYVYYKDASNKSITIFDIDDAGADVEKKIQEIKDILGDGVGSGETETVSAQLAALSGNNASTSADTSVEGAKRYADQILSDTISALDYSGVTTGEGVYVTNVTEADGKVAATTATLPTVGAISEAGKPITAVSESLGAISATAGTINAEYVNIADSGSLISATTVEGALAEIAAEIDAMDKDADVVAGQVVTTVSETDGKVSETKANVKDLQLGGYTKTNDTGDIASADTINVALSKLENTIGSNAITNDDGSITVTPANGSTTDVKLHIKEGEKVIKLDGNGGGIYTNLNLVEITGSTLPAEVKVRYELRDSDDTKIGESIDIPKDSHIVSINYITEGEHAQNLEYVYIDVSGETKTTYVDMSALVLEAEFASGVTVDAGDHIVHGVVDQTSEKNSGGTAFLTVGADGFKVSGIKQEIIDRINELDANVTGGTTAGTATSNHIQVVVGEADGKLTAVTVTETNIADKTKLEELSAKTVTEVASSNESITAALSAATDGTKHLDIITDASKIKMSGFTSTDVLSGINATSSVTEAFKEVDKVITDNEEVVSAALNDLEATKVENITVNGVEGTFSGKVASVTIDGGDIELTGYVKAQTTSAIAPTDDVNTAIGKLEKGIEEAVEGGLQQVEAGSGITVSAVANNKQTIDVKLADANNITGVAENAIKFNSTDSGLYIDYLDCGIY